MECPSPSSIDTWPQPHRNFLKIFPEYVKSYKKYNTQDIQACIQYQDRKSFSNLREPGLT